MTTKKVTKLLAVVAFATSPVAADPAPIANRAPITAAAPAAGAPAAKRTIAIARAVAPDPWAATAIVRVDPVAVLAAPATGPSTFSLTALVERIVQPRTMPSGAPACGNVASRAPQPADCGRRRP